MIFLVASTCIAKEVKAKEFYTIAEGMLGYDVTYTIKMAREYKLGEDMPIAFKFRVEKDMSFFNSMVPFHKLPQGALTGLT